MGAPLFEIFLQQQESVSGRKNAFLCTCRCTICGNYAIICVKQETTGIQICPARNNGNFEWRRHRWKKTERRL